MSEALKAFVAGIGETLDIGATCKPRRKYKGAHADYKALSSDWERVGNAMSFAMRRAKSEAVKSSQVKTR